MTTNDIRDLILSRKQKDAKFQSRIGVIRCITVGIDYPNDCAVMNRQGYVWVRERKADGAIFQVFNDQVKRLVGLYVLVSDSYGQPYRRVIVGVDWDVTPETSEFPQNHVPSVYSHAQSHEWQDTYPAADAVSIYPRALIPFRVVPSTDGGVKLDITRGIYQSGTTTVIYSGETKYDLTSYIPASGYSVGILIYLDPNTNAASHITGFSTTGTVVYPDIPEKTLPLAYIKLTGGMTSITESNIILDLRPLYNVDNGIISREVAILAEELDLKLSRHVVEGV